MTDPYPIAREPEAARTVVLSHTRSLPVRGSGVWVVVGLVAATA